MDPFGTSTTLTRRYHTISIVILQTNTTCHVIAIFAIAANSWIYILTQWNQWLFQMLVQQCQMSEVILMVLHCLRALRLPHLH